LATRIIQPTPNANARRNYSSKTEIEAKRTQPNLSVAKELILNTSGIQEQYLLDYFCTHTKEKT
jgi:hypothetical protein